MDAFVKEMDDNGIVKAVLMGRHADNFGIVDNDELYELTQSIRAASSPSPGSTPARKALSKKWSAASPRWASRASASIRLLNPPLKGDDPIFTPVYDKCAELGGILVMSVSAALGPT